jgi:hypothetical protein
VNPGAIANGTVLPRGERQFKKKTAEILLTAVDHRANITRMNSQRIQLPKGSSLRALRLGVRFHAKAQSSQRREEQLS